MTTTLPRPIRFRGREQLTIPKEVREALKLDEESQLNIFVVGRCLAMTPGPLMRGGLARDVEKAMKAQGMRLDDLLKELKNMRQRFVKEKYGS